MEIPFGIGRDDPLGFLSQFNIDAQLLDFLIARKKQDEEINMDENLRKKVPKTLVLCFRLILAASFLTAAFGKLVDIERYSVQAVYFFVILPFF